MIGRKHLFTAALVMMPVVGFASTGLSAQVKRGHYLVELAGCGHCHTPGHFRGREDTSRELAGGDVGFEVPGAGTYVGPNLTPDIETGLGKWTDKQVATAIRGGVRPDGRVLSPVMPWPEFSHMSDADLKAIIAYLRALPPIVNKVPGPFPAGGPIDVSAWRMFIPPQEKRQSHWSRPN
jgi:mono/diheme cytochrome c family protein